MTLSIERPSLQREGYGGDTTLEAGDQPTSEFDALRKQSFGGHVFERVVSDYRVPDELQHPDNPVIQLGDAR